jgi:alanine dehydrogenase
MLALRIGLPKEIKPSEDRVALTPAGAHQLVTHGHTVAVQAGAGVGSGFTDEEYRTAGASVVPEPGDAWAADLVVKVKEPQPLEFPYFRPGLCLFTYLHLAPEPELTRKLVETRVDAIAYETVQRPDGSLPLLEPMSEVAGRMAVQVGAHFLERPQGGRGVLLAGVPGVAPGHVVIVGGGTVGANAAKVATGIGARVTLLDINAVRLRQLDDLFGPRLTTLMSTPYAIAESVADADLLIGAVLVPGARAPKLVSEEMVRAMRPGSVIVDVAIDQGGSIATIDRITTHTEPTYVRHGVVHYAVANMPGAVPRTSTLALTNVTLPYALELADKGPERALRENPSLAKGVNTWNGHVAYKAVADAHGMPYVALEAALA